MEQWKPCKSNIKYEVSDQGRVRHRGLPVTVKRKSSRSFTRVKPARLLKTYIQRNGYVMAALGNKHHTVHRLVAIAFISDPPFPKAEVNHIDGNKENNNVSNLEWRTKSGNIRHSFTHLGRTNPKGQDNNSSVLKDAQVLMIRRRISEGATCAELGRQYGVDRTTIQCIKLRKTWKHL